MEKKEIQIYNFIISQLTKNSDLPVMNDKEIMKLRYLDIGQIDSMELIRFIFNMEKKFKIKLSEKETSSDKFRYIGGLIKIISKKIN